MRFFFRLIPLPFIAAAAFGQLTLDQKMSDFMNIVGVYDKQYGPYDWKKQAFGYDLLQTAPWIEKIRAGKDDLDFAEVLVSYIASLNDAHDLYELPSNFVARLNFSVDIYDDKLLVDTINRQRLPSIEFPFQVGYELVSIDGQDAQKMLDGLLQYEVAANPRSTRRLAATLLTVRPQVVMPHAAGIPEISTVVFRRPDGARESYRIPWSKTGLALTTIGKYITPASAPPDDSSAADPGSFDPALLYMQPLLKLWNCQLPDRGVIGFGSQFPVFVASMPAGFTVRLAGRLTGLSKYAAFENPISTRRLAATRMISRPQSIMPYAPQVGDAASMVVRRASGDLETYNIPWQKTGTPLQVGPVPDPHIQTTARKKHAALADGETSGYESLLNLFTYSGVDPSDVGVLNFGARSPIFLAGLPSNFTRRLGGNSADFYYSGIFKLADMTLGYIRIPNYAPASQPLQLQVLEREIAYMNANSDGLIVDEMRNTGGFLCFGENIAARLIPYQFHATGFQVRATWNWVVSFYNAMMNAKAAGAPPDVITRYENLYNALVAANSQQRGLSEPVPFCTSSLNREPATDDAGNIIAYQKPLMLLIDEFSVSTADSVAGMLQDAGRGILFGQRTNGAGGTNTTFDAGPFSGGVAGMTLGLQVRKAPVATPDYPTTPYIENVGVRPDMLDDYMTRDNLLQNGAPFINDFLEAMAAYVRQSRN